MSEVALRSAKSDDEDLLFEWRNIDELVALSYYREKVSIEEHHAWFRNKLASSSCSLLIIQVNGNDAGLIRLEQDQGRYEVTIYLIPGNEGKGYGSLALAQALSQNNICEQYQARVQLGNVPSQKLFTRLGFVEVSRDDQFILYHK